MANTRNRNNNNNNNNNNNEEQPQPTVAQLLAVQTQILQVMQQNMAQGQNQAPPPRDKLGEFQTTKPLTFSHSIKPMDADDWLKTIEKKLQIV